LNFKWKHRDLGRYAALAASVIVIASACGFAQSRPVERTVHAPKADVEAALRRLQAYSGAKLPAVQGFVGAGEDPLDHFRQPYYQYSIKLTSMNETETVVRVAANITAWYAADEGATSGYRALPSNGRLESDLFDRLDEALRDKARAPSTAMSSSPPTTPGETTWASGAGTNEPPDAASAAKAAASSPFHSSTGVTADASTRNAPPPDKKIEQLKQEAKSLQEILDHQSKPDDLAIVRESGTPVLATPSEKAKVLFVASAEDEFQVLKVEGDFVHVQMTGLSRGYVRRNELDLSNVSAQLIGPLGEPKLTPEAGSAFKTREENGVFPGDWAPLKGKQVKIVWVQAGDGKEGSPEKRARFAKSMFRKTYPEMSRVSDLAGVVIVFDEADGGMAAATAASLQQLNLGKLSEDAFWRQCWFDPPEAFHNPTVR
jgi:hypothetical protein